MTKYQVKKGIISQKIKDVLVLFDNEKSLLYNLNETAAYIFLQIKKKLPEEKIAAVMEKRYKVSREQALKDIRSLITQLLRKKILGKVSK